MHQCRSLAQHSPSCWSFCPQSQVSVDNLQRSPKLASCSKEKLWWTSHDSWAGRGWGPLWHHKGQISLTAHPRTSASIWRTKGWILVRFLGMHGMEGLLPPACTVFNSTTHEIVNLRRSAFCFPIQKVIVFHLLRVSVARQPCKQKKRWRGNGTYGFYAMNYR